jgi:hypothetical protein
MYCKRFCFVAVAVALAVVLGALGATALAEQPEPQTRHFAYLLPHGAEECPDLEDPASVAIIAHGGQGSNMWIEMWAGSASNPLPLGGTSWFTGDTVVTHVKKGGAEKYDFLWEDAAPPNGTVANTGPEGDAVFIATYRIRPVTSSEYSLAHSSLWRVDENASNAQILCVGVGNFSK